MFSADPKPTETGGLEFRRDLITIEIFKIQEDYRERVANADGSYLEKITYDGDTEPIWTINQDI